MSDYFNPVFSGRPVTIFAVMSALANKHDAINLGQGFPDEAGPQAVLDFAANALLNGNNQYGPVTGVPELRQAVARSNKRFYDLDVNWENQVLVTSGASEALAASFLGLLQPGDEAILFTPYYDSYAPMVEAAGAHPVLIDLQAPDWRIDADILNAAITDKTKVIAINSPHNPLGKVMDREELSIIAEAAIRHDLYVVCDEVYEHLVFDGLPHIPLMTFPGMHERCVRIGSAGKTFSLTGWRIGYLTGPEKLVTAITKARQFMGYTTPHHTQLAVAHGLDFGDHYYQAFTTGMQDKRDYMMKALKDIGMDVLPCSGTYFLTVDIRSVGGTNDMAFCEEITKNAGVAAVPLSSFYHHQLSTPPRHFVRFCFCKKETVLSQAAKRLGDYFSNQ